ncbi:MAG: hypothetical protein R3C49_20300 [Planctomycetaceae bacterium]
MRNFGRCGIALLFAITSAGCATGPLGCLCQDKTSCQEPGSCEWWAEKALAPPGVRNRCYKGKNWPVRPRPSGPPQQFTHTYHSAHYWPLPYVCQDRDYVRDIVEVQRSNGWQQATTLFERHFEDDQSLSTPGRLHLIDIMEVTPDAYRTVYIQSTYDPEIDNVRMASVQQAVLEMTGGAETIPVVLRQARDYKRPASEIKAINDMYIQSVPTPRLSGSGGGGAASGVSSAASAAAGP